MLRHWSHRLVEHCARHPNRSALLGIWLVFVLANITLILGFRGPRHDADEQFAPAHLLIADFARSGQLLQWNPWLNGGSPDGVDPEWGAYSPITVGLAALMGGDSELSFRVYWLVIWFLGGLGMFQLLRSLGIPAWGTFAGSSAFLLSGFYVGHGSHTSWVHAWSSLPWVIWRLDVALKQRSWLAAVQAGALWGVAGLAGYPGLVLSNGMLAFLWTLGRVLCRDEEGDKSEIGRALVSLSTVVLVGVVVLAPAYVGFKAETDGFSGRNGALPRDAVGNQNPLHPLGLATLASPHLAMHESSPRDVSDATSLSVYIGAIPAWLAVLALVLRPRSRWRWWLLATAMLMTGLALGHSLPLRGWLYDLCPPTRYFRHATLFRGPLTFLAAILAGLATVDIGRACAPAGSDESRRTQRLVRASAVVIAFMALVGYVGFLRNVNLFHKYTPAAHGHLVLSWGAILLLAFWMPSPSLIRRTSWIAVLVLCIGLDLVIGCHLANGVMTTRRRGGDAWEQVAARHQSALELGSLARYPESELGNRYQNKTLALKHPIVWGYQPMTNDLHQEWASDPILAACLLSEDRIFFAPRDEVTFVRPSSEHFEALRRAVHETGSMPILLHRREELSNVDFETPPTDAIGRLPVGTRVPVDLLEYSPDTLSFRCRAPEAGYLLVTDRWAPGWRATVDGKAAEVHPGNFLFRAVEVHAGENLVSFNYRVFGFPYLVIVSWSLLGIVLTASAVVSHRNRSSESAAAGEPIIAGIQTGLADAA